MDSQVFLWVVFNIFVLGILALDLLVLHRKAHTVSLREALAWSCVWVSLALIFGLGIYFFRGGEKALEFLTGYVIEWSLSVDNLFVFLVIFSYFAVPPIYQHRVLFWGILGALVLRAVFIATGAALLANFHWMIYVFGGFLIFTGIKLLFVGEEKIEPEKNPAVTLGPPLHENNPGLPRTTILYTHRWKAVGYSSLSGACGRRDHRCYFRRRFNPGHLRYHFRPIHRLYLQCLCHPWTARSFLPPRRRHGDVPLPQGRSSVRALFRRREDADCRVLQNPHRHFAGRRRRNFGDFHPRFYVEAAPRR